ncbi:MAG TPA: signal recognition particle-docking protein FtsY, partial [Micromonospora sp.]
MDYLVLALIMLGVLLLAGLGLVVPRLRRRPQPPVPARDVDTRTAEEIAGPPREAVEAEAPPPGAPG